MGQRKTEKSFFKTVTVFFLSILAAAASTTAAAESGGLELICDDWPPYQIVEKDRISGFSTEVVNTVLGKMGQKAAHIEVYPWKRAIVMFKRGKADGLFSVNDTPERRQFAYYPAEPIVISPWVMWVRKKDNLAVNSLEDLKDLSVGVVRGYSYTPEFWRFLKTGGHYEEVVDDLHNFRKLSAGRLDVVVAELGNGGYLLEQLNIRGVIPLNAHPIKVDGLYLIFNKKTVSKSFVKRFSIALGVFKQSPDYQRLYLRYCNLAIPSL